MWGLKWAGSLFPFFPTVGGEGVLPEIFLVGFGTFGGEVGIDDVEDGGVGGTCVGDGPVAAKEEAVWAEGLPEVVEDGQVVGGVCGGLAFGAFHLLDEGGDFHKDVGVLGEFLDVLLPTGGDGSGIAGAAEVVDDDAEVGDICGELEGVREGIGGAVEIEGEAAAGEEFGGGEDGGLVLFQTDELAPPADAAEEGMGGETCEMLGETGIGGIKISHTSEDAFLTSGKIEHPLIILQPRAGFDDDGLPDAVRASLRAPVGRHDFAVELGALVRPGNALGPCGIVEMCVGIDDARGGRGGLR